MTEHANSRSPLGEFGTTHILVVDDDPFMRELAQAILADAGRVVFAVESGAAALSRLAQPAPKLVLLDLALPDISGLEVLKHLRSAPGWEATRVVMLTASGDIENLVEAKRLGAAGYIQKPFTPTVLAARVQELLDRPDILWMDDQTRSSLKR